MTEESLDGPVRTLDLNASVDTPWCNQLVCANTPESTDHLELLPRLHPLWYPGTYRAPHLLLLAALAPTNLCACSTFSWELTGVGNFRGSPAQIQEDTASQ